MPPGVARHPSRPYIEVNTLINKKKHSIWSCVCTCPNGKAYNVAFDLDKLHMNDKPKSCKEADANCINGEFGDIVNKPSNLKVSCKGNLKKKASREKVMLKRFPSSTQTQFKICNELYNGVIAQPDQNSCYDFRHTCKDKSTAFDNLDEVCIDAIINCEKGHDAAMVVSICEQFSAKHYTIFVSPPKNISVESPK